MAIMFLAFFVGIPWCCYIVRRIPDDIQELKTTDDRTARIVIVLYWIIIPWIHLS